MMLMMTIMTMSIGDMAMMMRQTWWGRVFWQVARGCRHALHLYTRATLGENKLHNTSTTLEKSIYWHEPHWRKNFICKQVPLFETCILDWQNSRWRTCLTFLAEKHQVQHQSHCRIIFKKYISKYQKIETLTNISKYQNIYQIMMIFRTIICQMYSCRYHYLQKRKYWFTNGFCLNYLPKNIDLQMMFLHRRFCTCA